MKHVLLEDKNKLAFQNKPIHPNHAITNNWPEFPVKFAGICHSDISITNNPENLPIILGHEIVCYETVDGQTQYYVICNEIHCNKCQYCLDKNFSHCENLIELGINEHGGYAEFIKIPRECLLPIYFNNPKIGVLVEPLSCVLHALDRIKILLSLVPKNSIKILILGCGVIGKMFAHLLLRTNKNYKIYLYDINLAPIISLLNLENVSVIQQPKKESMNMVIECSGATNALKLCKHAIRKGGVIFLFGIYNPKKKFPLSTLKLVSKELTISSSLAGSNCKTTGYSMMEKARDYIMAHQGFFETFLGKSISLEQLPKSLLFDKPIAGTRTIVEIT